MANPTGDNRKSPWRLAIERIMADLKPHTYDEIVAEVGDIIPAGQAFRKAEASRVHVLKRKKERGEPVMHEDLERVKGDRETAVRAGRRSVVIQTIDSMQRVGQVRRWNEGGVMYCQKVMDDGDRIRLIREALLDKTLRDWELLSRIAQIAQQDSP